MEPKILCRIKGRSTYSGRDIVFNPDSVSPTVMANWGVKSPPPTGSCRIRKEIIVLATFGGGRLHNQCILGIDGICPCITRDSSKDMFKVAVRK